MALTREITLLCRIVYAECWNTNDQQLDTSCVSAAAAALMALAARGLIGIVGTPGRCMRADWIVDEWQTSPGSSNDNVDPDVIDAMLQMAEQFRGGPVDDIELDAFSPGLNDWVEALDFLECLGAVRIIEKGQYVVSEQEHHFLVAQKRILPGDKTRHFPTLKASILHGSGG